MILIGPEIFAAQAKGGISRGFVELFKEATSMGADWHLWLCSSNNIHARDLFESDHIWPSIHGSPRPNEAGSTAASHMRRKLNFRQFCLAMAPSVVHHTYYSPFSSIPKGIAQVETLHDLCDEQLPITLDMKQKFRSIVKFRSLERADAIVCVSLATKSVLEEMRPDLAAKATVIHHGIRRSSHSRMPSPLDRPYFLFVGKRGGYKNFSTVAKALSRSEVLRTHSLVCFGGEPTSENERRMLHDHSLVGRISFEGGNDDRLTAFYQNAIALIYPSQYEGFGFPVLEAMASGCPVLSSDTTSLPEIGGTAAVYASPNDIDAWQFAMETVADNPSLRSQLILAGAEQIEQFSWQTSVELHNRLYCDLSVR